MHLMNEMLQKAIENYKKTIAIKPDFPEAHNYLGIIHYTQNNFDDAISEFNEAIGRAPIVKISLIIPPTPVAAP